DWTLGPCALPPLLRWVLQTNIIKACELLPQAAFGLDAPNRGTGYREAIGAGECRRSGRLNDQHGGRSQGDLARARGPGQGIGLRARQRDDLWRGGMVQQEGPLGVAGFANGVLDAARKTRGEFDPGRGQECGENASEICGFQIGADVDGLAFAEVVDRDGGFAGVAPGTIGGGNAGAGWLENGGPEARTGVGTGQWGGKFDADLLVVKRDIVLDGGAHDFAEQAGKSRGNNLAAGILDSQAESSDEQT